MDTPNFYDNVLVNIRFENGGLGSITGVCPCDYGYDARVEIVGEKGILQIGELQGQAVVICSDRDQGLITPIYRTWPERFAQGYILEMEHFVNSIRNGTPPEVGGVEGRWAVAGVLAGTRSFLEERPVRLTEVLESQRGALMNDSSMRAIVYHGPNDLRVEQRTIPMIAGDEALLRVGSSSICGTDLRIYHGEHRKYTAGTVRIPGSRSCRRNRRGWVRGDRARRGRARIHRPQYGLRSLSRVHLWTQQPVRRLHRDRYQHRRFLCGVYAHPGSCDTPGEHYPDQ